MPKRSNWTAAAVVFVALVGAGCSRNVGPPPDDYTDDIVYRVALRVADGVTVPTGVLFVGARRPGGGPPVYVARARGTGIPDEVVLTEGDQMMTGAPPPGGPLTVFARLDQDGDASTVTPGDLLGESEHPAEPGAELTITLAPRAAPAAPAGDAFEITLGGHPLPPAGTLYVLAVPNGQRMPRAAARYDMPPSLPATVGLDGRHLLGPPPASWNGFRIVVKADQDGNPATDEPGDLRGIAPIDGRRIAVELVPIDPAP